MKMLLLASFTSLAIVPAALAQHAGHAAHDMSGHQLDASVADDPHAGHRMPSLQTEQDHHTGHEQPPPQRHDGIPHAGHNMPAGSHASSSTDLPVGNAPAPSAQPGLAASRYWGAEAMAQADAEMRREHGGMTYHQVILNIAEYQARGGDDGYRWDGEAWIGGDINRFTLKSEGEGSFGGALDGAEVQALYSRALDPYWNLQVGLRHDFGPDPSRTYAVVGVEGLAPYWFEVEGALFLSDKGDLFARAEAYYDQRITQDLVLQPRVEANLAAQDVPENRIGSGLTNLELGLRLRFERKREFAPYVGLSWERQFGDTAKFSRAVGEDTGGFAFVAGVRTWF
ncbi:copper resistance protein B [Novosphingobium sp. M1R2S20]|uniref:Copper resistance protein B n=1 Tax=Novosphingobium rhizovicinum TaxID=3228928 RepID=A0ABV3R953_9SPHN